VALGSAVTLIRLLQRNVEKTLRQLLLGIRVQTLWFEARLTSIDYKVQETEAEC
jgi:hypothetical protein